ncbi:hypothetical protein Taro_023880 [Colocasia esculenta]|uniref:Uncharacterized protein n=1 Tax=Colocasia esculenta TaxID=4460 RepID=A0A843V7Q5_COLES|nr:hypothetical protein [Colocasia esculenta]
MLVLLKLCPFSLEISWRRVEFASAWSFCCACSLYLFFTFGLIDLVLPDFFRNVSSLKRWPPRVMRDNILLLDRGHDIVANGSIEELSDDGEVDASLIKQPKGIYLYQRKPSYPRHFPLDKELFLFIQRFIPPLSLWALPLKTGCLLPLLWALLAEALTVMYGRGGLLRNWPSGDSLEQLIDARSALSFLPAGELGLLQFGCMSRGSRPYGTRDPSGVTYHLPHCVSAIPHKLREAEESRLKKKSLMPIFIDDDFLHRHFSSLANSYIKFYNSTLAKRVATGSPLGFPRRSRRPPPLLPVSTSAGAAPFGSLKTRRRRPLRLPQAQPAPASAVAAATAVSSRGRRRRRCLPVLLLARLPSHPPADAAAAASLFPLPARRPSRGRGQKRQGLEFGFDIAYHYGLLAKVWNLSSNFGFGFGFAFDSAYLNAYHYGLLVENLEFGFDIAYHCGLLAVLWDLDLVKSERLGLYDGQIEVMGLRIVFGGMYGSGMEFTVAIKHHFTFRDIRGCQSVYHRLDKYGFGTGCSASDLGRLEGDDALLTFAEWDTELVGPFGGCCI